MAVRCSLLGHDFGATEVEREREERGSEVVVTVTEYEACTRCGTRNVKSENTEVRGLDPEPVEPDPTDADPTGARDDIDVDPTKARDETDPEIDPSPDSAEEPATLDAEADDSDPEGLPTDDHGDPITDDAEILDDATDEPAREREHGAWPDSDDVGQPSPGSEEPAQWPEVGSDATDDPEQSTEDPAIETGAATVTSHQGGQGSGSATGIERAGAAPTPGETTHRDDVPVEFFCPRCSFVAPGDRSSLRAGDICPECKKGYLGERER
ncbi:DUF7093 family protein [Halovivax cerinus]|uniref:Zn-finger containing protein n=1 Tax=Halovivax cerinus TaxID=1487865 RepID=A0ABD5NSS5_9EURY|nr:hypothetical protein [Halovivax cerinus]